MGSVHVIFSQFIKVVNIYKILEMYVFSGENLKLLECLALSKFAEYSHKFKCSEMLF